MKPTTLFAAAVLFFLSFAALAQDQSEPDSLYRRRGAARTAEAPEAPGTKPNWMERITLGGNFGLSFGNYTYVNLSPLVGYRFTDKFTAGGGFTYIYNRWRIPGYQAVSNNIYGGRVMAQYAIIPRIAPTFEYEALNVPYPDYNDVGNIVEARRWIGNPMIGATVLFPIGRKSNFGLTALYNINYNTNRAYSPYGSPWVIRAGFML
ncbi:MAG: hypothetical protein ICV83_31395 [Cytophagales bacterium]|nr:hypothetical protein [Cytophagales bacterium]